MKYALLLVVLISALSGGCNIFSWTSSEEASHVEKGLELMRQADYEEAEAEFAMAMAEDPANADARYYHAKAVLYSAGFDIIDLIQELSQEQEDRHRNEAELPLFSMATPLADETYRVNLILVDDLSPIYAGDTHGTITAEDIDVDLAFAYLITAILSLRDTNQDGTITDDDLILDIHYSSTLQSYSIVGLHQFLEDEETPHLFSTNDPPINPEQINTLIDVVKDLVENSTEVVVSVIRELTGETDIDALETLLEDIRTAIVKYYYDNDIDDDGNNGPDEETLNGSDDDNDGYIDEDTDLL
jgi:tetratricopeptide (TPR) repeat protein